MFSPAGLSKHPHDAVEGPTTCQRTAGGPARVPGAHQRATLGPRTRLSRVFARSGV